MKAWTKEDREIEDAFIQRLQGMTKPEMRQAIRALVRVSLEHGGERFLWWAQGDGGTTVDIHPAARRYCGAASVAALIGDAGV